MKLSMSFCWIELFEISEREYWCDKGVYKFVRDICFGLWQFKTAAPTHQLTRGQGVVIGLVESVMRSHIDPVLVAHQPNTRRWTNADLVLGQRRRRWSNIKLALVQCLVFAGVPSDDQIPVQTGAQWCFNGGQHCRRCPSVWITSGRWFIFIDHQMTIAQWRQDDVPILFQCCSSVADTGPPFKQH